jgi:hypothetical protein
VGWSRIPMPPLIQEPYRDFNIEPVAASYSVDSHADKRGPVSALTIRNFCEYLWGSKDCL